MDEGEQGGEEKWTCVAAVASSALRRHDVCDVGMHEESMDNLLGCLRVGRSLLDAGAGGCVVEVGGCVAGVQAKAAAHQRVGACDYGDGGVVVEEGDEGTGCEVEGG